jgi:hypothetical protein
MNMTEYHLGLSTSRERPSFALSCSCGGGAQLPSVVVTPRSPNRIPRRTLGRVPFRLLLDESAPFRPERGD